jgi:hypothetical protein
MAAPNTRKPGSTVMHVGADRCDRLKMAAIEISYRSQTQVTQAEFLRYILDNYMEYAQTRLISDLSKNTSKE